MGAAERPAGSPAAPTRLAECAGTVHIPSKSPHAERITWYRPPTMDNARAVKWSCADHDEVYELLVLGARWFIRRSGVSTHETVRDTRAEAERLWSLLLAGAAR